MQEFESFPSTAGFIFVSDCDNQLSIAIPAIDIRDLAKTVFKEHQESEYSRYCAEHQAILKASQTIFVDYIETPELSDDDQVDLEQ